MGDSKDINVNVIYERVLIFERLTFQVGTVLCLVLDSYKSLASIQSNQPNKIKIYSQTLTAFVMGRKKSKRAPVKKKAFRPKLDTSFACPFCNEEHSVECKL